MKLPVFTQITSHIIQDAITREPLLIVVALDNKGQVWEKQGHGNKPWLKLTGEMEGQP
jgi:hypothetical protein